jgi:hypothetical protein
MSDAKQHDDNAAPPDGFDTWLDYAVDTLDLRTPELLNALEGRPFVGRDAMRSAARKELRDLRAKAAQLTVLLAADRDGT